MGKAPCLLSWCISGVGAWSGEVMFSLNDGTKRQDSISNAFGSLLNVARVETQKLDSQTSETGAPVTVTPLLGGESETQHPVWASFATGRSNSSLGASGGSGWTWNNGGIW